MPHWVNTGNDFITIVVQVVPEIIDAAGTPATDIVADTCALGTGVLL